MHDLLASHAADPERMRADDFRGFIAARTGQLLELVGNARGKRIPWDQPASESEDPGEDVEEALDSIAPEIPA